jgi:hypothetical protein
MSNESIPKEDLIDTPVGEKLADILLFADDYLCHVGDNFVTRCTIRHNPDLYTYTFTLPHDICLIITTDNFRYLEYSVQHSCVDVMRPTIEERVIQIVLEYLAFKVDVTLNNTLNSVVRVLNKELDILEDKEKLSKNDSNDLDGQLLLDLEFEE